MAERPTRHLTDRDLRALTTDDLLAVIRDDIRELDQLILARRSLVREAKAVRRTKQAEAEAAVPEPDALPLHAVTCCNHHMGDFPPFSRVRCPFCGDWHRAGDFPQTG